MPKGVLEIIEKAACFWILVEEHSASRLCAAVCSFGSKWVGCEKVDQSPHDRDGHAPLICAAKSNFKETMVLPAVFVFGLKENYQRRFKAPNFYFFCKRVAKRKPQIGEGRFI